MKKQCASKWWCTRPDDFANVWDKIVIQLNINPTLTVKVVHEGLIKDSSN